MLYRSLDPRFFRRVQTSVQTFTPEMIFSNDELYIILKRRHLEISNPRRRTPLYSLAQVELGFPQSTKITSNYFS